MHRLFNVLALKFALSLDMKKPDIEIALSLASGLAMPHCLESNLSWSISGLQVKLIWSNVTVHVQNQSPFLIWFSCDAFWDWHVPFHKVDNGTYCLLHIFSALPIKASKSNDSNIIFMITFDYWDSYHLHVYQFPIDYESLISIFMVTFNQHAWH